MSSDLQRALAEQRAAADALPNLSREPGEKGGKSDYSMCSMGIEDWLLEEVFIRREFAVIRAAAGGGQ